MAGRGNAPERDFLQQNKGDAIEWAKQRRAKAQAAAEKRAERKRKEEAALLAQQEYESQIEQYKQRAFPATSGSHEGARGGDSSPVAAPSWEDTPIGSAVKPARRQSTAAAPRPNNVPTQRRRQQRGNGGRGQTGGTKGDGPFGCVHARLCPVTAPPLGAPSGRSWGPVTGALIALCRRSWNDDFATGDGGPAWSAVAANVLDEEPPPEPAQPARRASRRRESVGGGVGGGGGSSSRRSSTAADVLQRKAVSKQAAQEQHEAALRQAHIQAAAERRMVADRVRRREATATRRQQQREEGGNPLGGSDNTSAQHERGARAPPPPGATRMSGPPNAAAAARGVTSRRGSRGGRAGGDEGGPRANPHDAFDEALANAVSAPFRPSFVWPCF
jgi:hypothetical protein